MSTVNEHGRDEAYEDDIHGLDPVHGGTGSAPVALWTFRLVFFMRAMACLSLIKGLVHWSQLLGIWAAPGQGFETGSISWQTATVFFAVFDLVAAVGLWLVATWGAVVWLASVASMITVELFFPQVFSTGVLFGMVEVALLAIYIALAIKSAQEQPQ